MVSIARIRNHEKSWNCQAMHRDADYHRDPKVYSHKARAHGLAGGIDEEAYSVERKESPASVGWLGTGSALCSKANGWEMLQVGRRERLGD